MTWKATCVMEERFRLIEAQEREEGSLAELCRVFGVSRKTGYKRLTRYEEARLERLQDLGRAVGCYRLGE
jgi:putative transposase